MERCYPRGSTSGGSTSRSAARTWHWRFDIETIDSMNRKLCMLSAAALIAAGVIVSAAEALRITPLVHDDWVLVSAELPDGYSEELHAAIASGLRTTITYDL